VSGFGVDVSVEATLLETLKWKTVVGEFVLGPLYDINDKVMKDFVTYLRLTYILWAPVAAIICAFCFEYVLTKKSQIKAGTKIFCLLLIQAVLFMPAIHKTHVVHFPVFWWEVFTIERYGPDGVFFEIELTSVVGFYFLLVAIAVVNFQQWRRKKKSSQTNPAH
jgi:hypothetical protein